MKKGKLQLDRRKGDVTEFEIRFTAITLIGRECV